jgi:integrase
MPLKLEAPREGKTPNWTIRGTYLGISVNRSAGTADKAVARKELKRIEREIERGRYEERAGPTFASAVVNYLKAGGDDRFIKPLLLHFKETPLVEIDQAAIDEAAHKLYPSAASSTRNRQVYTPVSSILKRAGVIAPLSRPKGHAGVSRVNWLWPEEAEELFDRAREIDPEFAAFLMVLVYTGLRLSEALEIQRRDLRLDEGFVYCGLTKNGEPRAVHLTPLLIAALSALPDRERVFRFRKNGHLYNLLRRAKDRAGLNAITFHTCRHTYAVWMRRYGGLDTRGLVGTGAWKDQKSAARYAHVVTTEEARKADLLPVPKAKLK